LKATYHTPVYDIECAAVAFLFSYLLQLLTINFKLLSWLPFLLLGFILYTFNF